MKKRLIVLGVLLVLILIGLVISGYYLYSNVNTCSSQECFYNSLSDCRKTSYISDTPETTIQYSILGISRGKCDVNVKMLQVKKGTVELSALEDKEMVCSLPLDLVVDPEKDLKNCHGILKEEIQNIIIQRMHAQIVENIGKISEEATKVL
jgi:hypothetical protein